MTAGALESRPWLSSYAEGVPADIEAPTQTLPEMMAASAKTFARRPALEFFGAVTTYRELGRQIERAAEGLAATRRPQG